jgi:hypothetical protein
MLDNSDYQPQSNSTLQRIADSNAPAKSGQGSAQEDNVALCKYHNRAVARGLIRLLVEHGIRPVCRTTRMYVFMSVSREDYASASEMVKEYDRSNPDTHPKSFSRDYDAAIIIGFVTVFVAGIITSVPLGLTSFAPVAVLVNGTSLAILAERWNRNDRYHVGRHFTVADVIQLMTMVALNIAVWQVSIVR